MTRQRDIKSGRALVIALLFLFYWLGISGDARADSEAGNRAHVAAGPYGRCYAKSVPRHLFDPEGQARQQGRTQVYDVLLQSYDWFSQGLFVLCGADEATVIRLGPWHRGHDPQADHLAIAFYRGGALIRAYSTLDIAGEAKADAGAISRYRNVAASVSHYSVFESGPDLVMRVEQDGTVFHEDWVIQATTVDGRRLVFDAATGALR